MNIPNPNIYFGKKVRVFCADGDIVDGHFGGYCFEYDKSGGKYTEIDIVDSYGSTIGFDDYEVDRIEVIGDIS